MESTRYALIKIRAHTSYLPGATRDFLAQLLASIERIAEDALKDPKESTSIEEVLPDSVKTQIDEAHDRDENSGGPDDTSESDTGRTDRRED